MKYRNEYYRRKWEKQREQLRVMYIGKKMTGTEIAKELGINSHLLYIWLRKFKITQGRGKKHSHIRPDLLPSSNLAYILGVLHGDGCVVNYPTKIRRGDKIYNIFINYVALLCKDKPFALSFFNALQSIGLKPRLRTAVINSRNYFRTVASNKEFVLWYKELKFNPNFYSILLDKYLNDDEKIIAFLRGYFESDGCYYYETYVNHPYMALGDQGEDKVKFVVKLIGGFGFNVKLYKMNCKTQFSPQGVKDYWMFYIRKGDEAERFIELIKPCIKNMPSNDWRFRTS